MSGFVGGLRAELVAAAERRARRRVPAVPPLVLAVAAAVALAAAAIVLVERRGGGEQRLPGPPADVRPLFGGSLEPGVRYGSVALVPAVSFEVGDGSWLANVTESSDALLLERVSKRDAAGAPVPSRGGVAIARPLTVYDPASGRAVAPPDDVVGWLRAHPDIDAGPARPAALAGLDGVVLDLAYRFDKPVHEQPDCEPLRLRGRRCTALGPGDWHLDGAIQRVYVLESEPGPLIVAVEGYDAEAFREVERAAQPLLDSLEVTRP